MIAANNTLQCDQFAFAQCNVLKNVNLSASTSIVLKNNVFERCSALYNLSMETQSLDIGQYCSQYCTALPYLEIGNITLTLGYYCFWYCSSLRKLTVLSHKLSLASYCFAYCPSISSININTPNLYIPYQTFINNTNLPIVKLKSDSIQIDSFAFQNCIRLYSFVLNARSVVFYPSSVCGCSSLDELVIMGKQISIQYYNNWASLIPTFHVSSIRLDTNKETGSSVTLSDYAFQDVPSIETLKIYTSTLNVGYGSFKNCIGLNDAELIFDTGTLNPYSFYTSTNIKKFVIRSQSVVIRSFSFGYTSELQTLVLKTAATILDSAFINNVALTNITFENNSVINSGAFKGCTALTTLYLAHNINIHAKAFSTCSIESILFHEDLVLYSTAFDQRRISFHFCGSQNNTNTYTCTAIKTYTSNVYVTAAYIFSNFANINVINNLDGVCQCFRGCNQDRPRISDSISIPACALLESIFYATS